MTERNLRASDCFDDELDDDEGFPQHRPLSAIARERACRAHLADLEQHHKRASGELRIMGGDEVRFIPTVRSLNYSPVGSSAAMCADLGGAQHATGMSPMLVG